MLVPVDTLRAVFLRLQESISIWKGVVEAIDLLAPTPLRVDEQYLPVKINPNDDGRISGNILIELNGEVLQRQAVRLAQALDGTTDITQTVTEGFGALWSYMQNATRLIASSTERYDNFLKSLEAFVAEVETVMDLSFEAGYVYEVQAEVSVEHKTLWRHCVEPLSLCEGNLPVTGGFPSQMPVGRTLLLLLLFVWASYWTNNFDVGDFNTHMRQCKVEIFRIQSSFSQLIT